MAGIGMSRCIILHIAFTVCCSCWQALALHLPCWSGDISEATCCGEQAAAQGACFDGVVYTAQECCATGRAILYPEADSSRIAAARTALGKARLWRRGRKEGVDVVHPAFEEAQLHWEKEHEKSSVVKVLNINGVRVVLHDFKGVWQYKTNFLGYEKSGYDPYKLRTSNPLGRDDVALDVGANLGLISILLAKSAHPSAKVFALEPHPALYRYLLWNLRENNVTTTVWPLQVGGCDPLKAPWLSLWPWWEPSSMRQLLHGFPDDVFRRMSTKVRAPCLCFREILRALNVRRLALLKLDCEGCEWGFLSADVGCTFARAVREARILRIAGELHHAGRFKSRLRAPILRPLCGGPRESCNLAVERCQLFQKTCSSAVAGVPEKSSEIRRPLTGIVSSTVFLASLVAGVWRLASTISAFRAWKAAAAWRPKGIENASVAQMALQWAARTSARLDESWWRGGISKNRRRLLARVSGTLLGRATLLLCQDNPPCVAQLGSRSMELLRRSGAHEAAHKVFHALKPSVPWVHEWQTPARYVTSLRSLPVWNAEDIERDGNSAVAEIVSALESGYPRILEDLRRFRARRWPPAYGPELIRRPHNWTKLLLYDGDLGGPPPAMFPGQSYRRRELHAGLCAEYAIHTCDILKNLVPGLRHPTLPYLQPDHEQVAFFHLKPGSTIDFHQASQNARVTIHLCLTGCDTGSRIQVGPRVLRWRQGRTIVFDDSYLHRVQIDPHRGRWILHVMSTHPSIDAPHKFARIVNDGHVWPG